MRVAQLDMTVSSQQCPSDLRQRTDGTLRTCAVSDVNASCSRVILPTNGRQCVGGSGPIRLVPPMLSTTMDEELTWVSMTTMWMESVSLTETHDSTSGRLQLDLMMLVVFH